MTVLSAPLTSTVLASIAALSRRMSSITVLLNSSASHLPYLTFTGERSTSEMGLVLRKVKLARPKAWQKCRPTLLPRSRRESMKLARRR